MARTGTWSTVRATLAQAPQQSRRTVYWLFFASATMLVLQILIVTGTLQLWDSRVFSAGAPAIAIALLGLGLPVVTLMFVNRLDVRMGSVIASRSAGFQPCRAPASCASEISRNPSNTQRDTLSTPRSVR